MALKVHKIVVVGCPRCVFTGEGREGAGKSCFCNRFVRPDCFSLQHDSRVHEDEWRDNSVYNGDHFLYWGAATKRLHDGTRARFQVVEQTEFYNPPTPQQGEDLVPHEADQDYITRATSTHFISRGKVAYKLHSEEEYAIPSSLKHNTSARATQLFPNYEFSEGKGNTNFIILYDPTLQGEDFKRQHQFLTKLIKELVKSKCKLIMACTKCDAVDESAIQLGAKFAATVIPKKPIPFIETSAKENINVEEVFLSLVGSAKKKKPFGLAPTYQNVVQSRSQDETYAMTTFNQIIKETVYSFSTEWSDIWPLLQSNPNCVKAVEVLGIENARKIFCQRLMELKVQELRSLKRQSRKLNQQQSSKSFQSQLLEAFSGHPDLVNDSVYDFVYSPSPTNTDATTPINRNSSLSEMPPTPTPIPTPTNPLPPSKPTDMPSSFSGYLAKSPPVPPPTSSIPSLCMDQTTPTRTALFSPTSTCQNMNTLAAAKLNRSTELLATLPQVISNISRTSSLRYRTLPPLPTNDNFPPTRRLSEETAAKSNPGLLDNVDDSSSYTSSSTLDRHRRLSNSMDCLLTGGTLFEEEGEEEKEDDVDASPYLEPVKALQDFRRHPDRPIAQSMRISRHKERPTIPFVMDDTSISNHSIINRPSTLPNRNERSFGSASPPPVPPTPKYYNLQKRHSPLLLGLTAMTPGSGESSLDFGNNGREGEGGDDKQDSDNVSIKSGPFAEIDDNLSLSESNHSRDDRSKSHTPDTHPAFLSRRSTYSSGVGVSVGLSRVPTSDKENLYASIPADEEYLTMRSGISVEELLAEQSKPRSSSVPNAQKVINKLKAATRTTIDLGRPGGVARHNTVSYIPTTHRVSETSTLSSVFEEPLASKRPAVQGVVRPLPPSPTKAQRLSPSKRKISSSGGHNIYESIDESEEWFQQLKREREARHREKMEQLSSVDPDLEGQCNTIMESFLKIPLVQQMWIDSVKSVLPNFQPPKENTIPPFTINPEYIISYAKSRLPSTASNEATDEVGGVPDGADGGGEVDETDEVIEEKGKTHRKLTVTDSILMRMNQSLRKESSSSESSSEEEEEEEEVEENFDYDEEEEEGNIQLPQEVWPEQSDTLKSDASLPLTVIHQMYHNEDDEYNDDIALDNFGELDTSSFNEELLQANNIHSYNYVVIEPSPTNASESFSKPSLQHSDHLSVCHLNSLDSGISATNGVSDEMTDLH